MMKCLFIHGVLHLTELGGNCTHILERSFSLGPSTSLEPTVRVDPKQLLLDVLRNLHQSLVHLLLGRDTGRMDIVQSRPDAVGVSVLVERMQQFQVALGVLDSDTVCIETLDSSENVVKVGVAHVGVDLALVGDIGGSEQERVDGPLEVLLVIHRTEWKSFADSWLVNLNGGNTGLGKVRNFFSKSKRKLESSLH
jgi:hypothetical protein